MELVTEMVAVLKNLLLKELISILFIHSNTTLLVALEAGYYCLFGSSSLTRHLESNSSLSKVGFTYFAWHSNLHRLPGANKTIGWIKL
jgi:hypothetical protein